MRKDYYIKPTIDVAFDKEIISVFPTIIFLRWRYRHLGVAIVEIWWLTFHIFIGEWRRKEVKQWD